MFTALLSHKVLGLERSCGCKYPERRWCRGDSPQGDVEALGPLPTFGFCKTFQYKALRVSVIWKMDFHMLKRIGYWFLFLFFNEIVFLMCEGHKVFSFGGLWSGIFYPFTYQTWEVRGEHHCMLDKHTNVLYFFAKYNYLYYPPYRWIIFQNKLEILAFLLS